MPIMIYPDEGERVQTPDGPGEVIETDDPDRQAWVRLDDQKAPEQYWYTELETINTEDENQ